MERKVKMKAADSKQSWSGRVNRVARFGAYAAVVAASLLVMWTWAGPASAVTAAKADATSEEAAAHVAPNYALEERFLPDHTVGQHQGGGGTLDADEFSL